MRVLKYHEGPVRAVAYSSDGKRLASGGDDHRIRSWALAGDDYPQSLDGHRDWVRGLAFSPSGKRLASVGWDNEIKLWDVTRGVFTAGRAGHLGGAWSLAYSPAGDTLVSGTGDGTLCFSQDMLVQETPRTRKQHQQ